MAVIELLELAEHLEEVALVSDQGAVQQFVPVCTQRSMIEFIVGIRSPW